MSDVVAAIADWVTIIGGLTVLAFILNHSWARRIGVWAGALRTNQTYPLKRRQRGFWKHRRSWTDCLLSMLSRLGSKTRQPMKPLEANHNLDPDVMELLAPYRRMGDDLRIAREKQMAEEQHQLAEAAERIALRRWTRDHRRLCCAECKKGLTSVILLCMEDCSWSDKRPKHLRHVCAECLEKIRPTSK